MSNLLLHLEQPPRQCSPRDGPRESRKACTLPRGEGARGEIILGRRWPRVTFFGALAPPAVLLALMILR
jgi:hypothetical protein